jgi:hypothetical protein
MHAHDRTLIASLGFADPDKKNRRHTLACQYLAQPEVSLRVLRALRPKWFAPFNPPTDLAVWDQLCEVKVPSSAPSPAVESSRSWCHTDPVAASAQVQIGRVEVPITKDRGYLVGFWDVVVGVKRWRYGLNVAIRRHDTGRTETRPCMWTREPKEHPILEWVTERKTTCSEHDPAALFIEVKAGPCDVGDIARQLALYQSHAPPHLTPVYLVATCWPMSAADKSTLLAKGVHHIRLGEPFEAYVKARESEQVEDGAGW